MFRCRRKIKCSFYNALSLVSLHSSIYKKPKKHTRNYVLNIILKNILVATLYYVFGRIGLILASDPVFATIFWPGAGIALGAVYCCGYRLLPGVFFGAAAVNIMIAYPDNTLPMADLIVRSMLMGLAPAVQAFVSVFLLKKFIGQSVRLETFKEVCFFTILAGPIGCLVSASVSQFILFSFGLMNWADLPLSWTTWYVGDMLGVLVFGPIFLVLLDHNISRYRKYAIIVPLVCIFVITVSVFLIARGYEKQRVRNDLMTDSELIVQSLTAHFSRYVEIVNNTKFYFEASEFVSEDEFKKFLKHTFDVYPSLAGLYWVPVSEEVNMLGDLRNQEALRTEYAMFSDERYDLSLIDLKMQPAVFSAFEDAYISHSMQILNDPDFGTKGEEDVFLAIIPIKDVETDPDVLKGFVFGLYRTMDVFGETMSDWQEKGINIRIFSLSDDPKSSQAEGQDYPSNVFVPFIFRVPFSFLNQNWSLFFYTTDDYLTGHINWGLWYVLAGSFLFTFISTGFLLVVTGHGAVTEKIVEEKTRQLKDQSHFLEIIMDNVPDMIFVKNERHEIVAANKLFLKLYSPEERATLIGRTGLEVFTPEEQDLFKEEDNKAFERGYSEVFETNTIEGKTKILFTRKTCFADAQGKRFLIGISRDVTELMRIQNHLESILMTTADGLMIIQENGEIETFNKACENIFGYRPDDIIGRPVSFLEPEIQVLEKGANIMDCLKSVDDQNGERESGQRVELLARHKDGSVFPIYLASSKVHVAGKIFYSAIVRDISKEKKAEEDLRRSNQELEDFAYVASHDLKAPLRHLSLSAHYLLQNAADDLDEKSTELLGIIKKSSERMFDMIDSLLAYSSVGKKDVELEALDLGDIIVRVKDMLEELVGSHDALIHVGDMPEVLGNKNLLSQLFQNLLQNAIKYRRSDLDPEVHISAEREGRFWSIRLEDNGIGIDPEYKDIIFKIFQRLHTEKEYQGTGIGLAICQRIAEFHGGSIRLDDKFTGGSCFIIKLPAI